MGMGKTAQIRVVCTVAVLMLSAMTVWAADDLLKTRQQDMKTLGTQIKGIKRIIDAGGNVADVRGPAIKIADIAAQIPALFPQGTGHGETDAKPEIWANWDDFTQTANDLKEQAQMLASAAQSGDLATVRAQFDKTARICGDCHEDFRRQR